MAELEKSLERYDVLDRIAVGGMAEVFLAKAYGAHGFEKTLAIKRILPELARDPEFEARFIAEAKVAVKLTHANIVQVLDFGRVADSLFIAMEYIDGLDLAALLRRYKDRGLKLPQPAAFQIAIELARALDFAHSHGVVHRDVSPSNILLSRAGEVKIADFGIAVAARPHRSRSGLGPRKVAVLDAGAGANASRLATALAAAVARESSLDGITDPGLSAALLGPLPDEDSATLATATRSLAAAQERLTTFEPDAAVAQAQLGISQLLTVEPSASSGVLLAELAFTEGLARLASGATDAALGPLALAHTLAPGRTLDPAHYVPEVIDAYDAARTPGGEPGAITVEGHGAVWLDGAAVATAPATVPASAGSHVVVLVGADRLPRGARVDVPAGGVRVVSIVDAPASTELQLARARRDAVQAPDAAARAAALERVARMTGATDVLVVTGDDDALQLVRFRTGHDLPPPEPLGDRSATQLLAPMVPAKPIAKPKFPVPVDPPPWWQKRWVQASVLGGVVAVVATAVILTSGTAELRGLDPDMGF